MLIFLCPTETKHQAEKLWLGTLDSELSPMGREQAADMAVYNRKHADRAYASPGTYVAEFASIALTTNPVILDEFVDRSMGTLTGRSYRETLAEFPRRNWLAWQRSYWSAPPEGESLFDISERVMTAFRTKILPVELTETVAIIAPADVLRILIGNISNKPEGDIPKISIEPAIPYIIRGAFER